MVEASSQNRAVSASSKAHPLRADDTSCQHETVVLPPPSSVAPRMLSRSGP